MSVVIGYVAAGMVGLGIILVAVGLAQRSSAGVQALTRAGLTPQTTHPSVPDATGGRLIVRLTGVLGRLRPGTRLSRDRASKVRRRLDRAGIALPPEAVMAAKVAGLGIGLVVGVILATLIGGGVLVGLAILGLASLIGFATPDLYVLHTAQARQQEIQRAVPETLDLLALTAQAGLGLEQGIAEVSGELTGPLGAELDRFIREQQLGRGRQAALQGMIDRTSSEDLRSLALALLQADQLGTPIATTLQVQAREMRRRRRARARERAGKAPVKLLFPLIFGIFPALFVIIMGPGALAIIEAFR